MGLRLASSCLAAALLAACAPGANSTLLGIVEDVVPADRETAECEWASGTGADSYGCIYFVDADFTTVKSALLSQLAAPRFVVSCRVDGRRFKVTATREDIAVHADVVVGNLVLPRNVNDSDEGYEIPAGSVAVDIRADQGGAVPLAAGGCA